MKREMLFAVLVGSLCLFVRPRAAAEANCSDMPTIITAADVDHCLNTFEKLEAWKQHWKIDASDNPSYRKITDTDNYNVASLSVLSPFFNGGSLRVSGVYLQELGYEALDTTTVYWAQKHGQRILLVDSNKKLEAYRGRWLFAEDCLKAVESALAIREVNLAKDQAVYELAIRDKDALKQMELPQLQELRGRHDKFQRERESIDSERQEIARFRALKGALDRVTERFRTLMLRSGPAGLVGPAMTLLIENRVRF